MKSTLVISLLCWAAFTSLAQDSGHSFPLQIGYYGPYGIQPGIKAGTWFDLSLKEIKKERKSGTITKAANFFISPQAAIFGRYNNHISFLINVDGGYRITNVNKRTYHSISVGSGYLTAFQVKGKSIDLSTGGIEQTTRERRGYFLPVINYSLGKQADQKPGWYTRFSYGRKISSKLEDAGFFAIEAGIQFKL